MNVLFNQTVQPITQLQHYLGIEAHAGMWNHRLYADMTGRLLMQLW
jgi:hypothetical protein